MANKKPAKSLFALVHSEPKVGKTWLAATAPKPMLVIDAEGGSRFIPKLRKVVWDIDRGEEPPKADGTWDLCVVMVQEYATVIRIYEWLKTGKHGFRSVAIDSLTEVQKRCIDKLTGGNVDHSMEQTDWGSVLRHLEDLVRKLRDLSFHPTHPLECVVLTTLTHFKDGKFRPLVKGQLAMSLPSYPDVIGYLHTATTDDGKVERRLAIQPVWPHIVAGDRTHTLTQKLGGVVAKPHLGKMLEILEDEEKGEA